MKCNRISIILFVWFIISVPSSVYGQAIPMPARIGNPNPVGSGARALGLSNAFIAVADDATAASWNPGGLTQLQKPELSFAFESISHSSSSKNRISDGKSGNFRGSDSWDFEDFNYASIVYPFVYKNKTHMVFSLNYFKLFRFDEEIELPVSLTDGFFSSSGIRDNATEGTLSVLSPAIGVDISSNLSVGITFNIWNQGITDSSSFEIKEKRRTTTSFFGTTNSDLHSTSTSRYEVEDGYSLVFGGLYRLNPKWTIGTVMKPAYTLDLDNDRTFNSIDTISGDIDNLSEQNNAELHFPWILGLGISYHPKDPLNVSFDITWTDWSDFTLEEDSEDFNPRLTSQAFGNDLKDAYSLRLGIEYVLEFEKYLIPLRCGIGYDPIPGIDEIDEIFTINVGAGLQVFDRFNIDLAYEFRWGSNVNNTALKSITSIDKGNQDVRQHRIMLSAIMYF